MLTIANTEMAAAWDGHEGDHWADNAERYESASIRHWERLVASSPIRTEDRVLDIGCGTGKSTRHAARLATSGSVLGVDLSARMLEHARRKSAAEGLGNVTFEQADAQVHPFDAESFDAAISSFGAMFFNDPVAAFTNIGRALVPGGRLAVLAWRELAENEWLMAFRGVLAAGRDLPQPVAGSPGPMGLADPKQVRTILGTSGYDDIGFQAVDEPLEFGTDGDDAFSFTKSMGIVEGLTKDLDEQTRARIMRDLHDMLVAHETPEGVMLDSAAWLITARRV